MKAPKNKLPLLLGRLGAYGQYTITYEQKEEVDDGFGKEEVIIDKYVGRIAGKELAKYIVIAANNFETALELLRESFDNLELCKDDDSKIITEKINKFLNKF
jgi:hypothetical protein